MDGLAIGAIIAVVSAAVAVLSWLASRRSADAAQRSATAAEGSLEIQRREAEAAQESRRRGKLADVVPLYWESRSNQPYRGFVLRNNGPAVARDIVAYQQLRGGQARMWRWPAMSAGETKGLLEKEQAVSDEELDRIGRPPDEGGDSYARLEWTNEDDSRDIARWRAIQHH